ncbi:hypothetical protein Ae201684P_012908 [Aphanomyces euteiches]|nr:hypothetical protein Ae201684P_012908 [Aphanomyces euteiches]
MVKQQPSMKLKTAQARRMIQYREDKKEEKAMLERSLARLEQMKANLTNGSKLSWKEVAKALFDHRHLAESHRNMLKSKVVEQEKLLRAMHSWVQRQVPIYSSPDNSRATWRNVMLLASPESRSMGKQWILQHMYHHAERIFKQYEFPPMESNEEIVYDLDYSRTEDAGFRSVFRNQVELAVPLEAAVAAAHETLLSLQIFVPHYTPDIPMLLAEQDRNTKQYAFVTPRDELVNVLCGEFRSNDKCVIVVKQIQDDESLVKCPRWRQRLRMIWCEFRQLADGRVKRRVVSITSQSVTGNGIVSLDEDAEELGVSLEDGFPTRMKQELDKHIRARGLHLSQHFCCQR